MAKLYLRFDNKVLKEIALHRGVITIGRIPGNLVHLDNPAVSARHARVYWETDHYVVEDSNSSNGTFVNEERIGKTALKDGDVIRVGKHTLEFRETIADDVPVAQKAVDRNRFWQNELDKEPGVPKLEATYMMSPARVASHLQSTPEERGSGKSSATAEESSPAVVAVLGPGAAREVILRNSIAAIGKSKLATVKLNGWSAPEIAAVIHRSDDRYFVVPAAHGIEVRVNDRPIARNTELAEGDVIFVAGVSLRFQR